MSDQHWTKERASWVLTRAGRSPAARRRGEKLMAAARRQDRHSANAGDSAYSEVTTRNVFHRNVMREEGAANVIGWFCWTVIWMTAVALAIGLAIVLAWAIYGAWYRLTPRLGHLRAAPLLGAAITVLLVGFAIIWFSADGESSVSMPVYLLLQVVVGLGWAAWLTRAYGWQAVKARRKASSSKIAPIRIDVAAAEAPPLIPAEPATIQVAEAPEPTEAAPFISVAVPDYNELEREDLP